MALQRSQVECLDKTSEASHSARTLRWQGWALSLGLHVALVVAALFMRIDVRPTVPPEPFHWEVAMVDPPPTAPAASASVEPAMPAPASSPPLERPAKPVVETRPVQRAMAQVRTIQPRTLPPVESRVVSREALRERAPVVDTSAAVVHSTGDVQQTQPVVQERRQDSVDTTAGAVQAAAAPVSRSQAVVSREGQPDARQAEEAVVQEMATVETAVATIRHAAPAEDSRDAGDIVQTQPVSMERRTPVVTQVQSVGQVRPHYGWLKADVMAQIERLKRYPQFALENKWEGRVVVRAVIRADGHLLELSIVESSGHEVLDRDSLDLLRRLSPVPLKHQLGAPHVTLRIPINYGIR
ncbi:MAG: TonB family protein [Nitrospira sp.]|nr:TonB family protein [Nitrospira sp.]